MSGVVQILGPLSCTNRLGWWREFVFDVVVVVQLFAVRDEKTLGSDSLDRLLLLGKMLLVGGTVGGSGMNCSVTDVTIGVCVGSDRGTATGSGGGPVSADVAISGGRGFRGTFVFFLFAAGFRPMQFTQIYDIEQTI